MVLGNCLYSCKTIKFQQYYSHLFKHINAEEKVFNAF